MSLEIACTGLQYLDQDRRQEEGLDVPLSDGKRVDLGKSADKGDFPHRKHTHDHCADCCYTDMQHYPCSTSLVVVTLSRSLVGAEKSAPGISVWPMILSQLPFVHSMAATTDTESIDRSADLGAMCGLAL